MTNVRRCPELDDLAAWCVREKQASPCAVVACAYRSAEGWRVDEGAAGHLAPGQSEASVDTVFDLASLTKPFSALTFARLVRAGLLDWHMPLGVPLRDAHGTPSDKVPLAWFVAHRSGLDGHRPLYAPLERGGEVDRLQALRQAGLARRPECEGALPQAEGFAPMYSDLGYLLFGEAMARASGVVLDDLIRQEVSEPLGLAVGSARQWRQWDPSFDERVAPTEHVAWRGGVIRGAVHDENAWAMAEDGACAHAGLFGSARDVARLGTAVLDACRGDRPAWLSPEDVEPLLRVRPGSTLRAGFDGKSSNGSSTAGKRCSPRTFGHLGFTGTSVWIDPDAEVVAVLLTNRVYPTRDSTAIQEVRPRVNDELFAWGMGKARG